MNTTLHRDFNFEKLTKYPHMKPEDVAVWEIFIEKFPLAFKIVNYDFCVGEGAEFLPTGEETADGRENKLYQKKIDVVAHNNELITLIEIKPEANMRALGQILTYKELFEFQQRIPGKTKQMIVAKSISNDMKSVFARYNIEIVLV